MPPFSTPVCGIDTSILVRLVSGEPKELYTAVTEAIQALLDRDPSLELVASNQVIGEAYITLQVHYRLSKAQAREGLRKLLTDSPIVPSNGLPVLALLGEDGGAGLMDRLIAQDYSARSATVLTLDHKMAKLPGVHLLEV